jgi:hypothetical protein
MLAQLDRQDRRKHDNAAAYRSEPDLQGGAAAPVVSVIGAAGAVAGLRRHLSSAWTIRNLNALDDVGRDDIVLLTGAVRSSVTAARSVLPRRTCLVALVDDAAGSEVVAAVLTAGADVCVRAGRPAILAGHLVACRRRQVARRWSVLQPQPG